MSIARFSIVSNIQFWIILQHMYKMLQNLQKLAFLMNMLPWKFRKIVFYTPWKSRSQEIPH